MCSMEKRQKHVGGCEQEKERNGEVAFVSLDISCFKKKNVIFCINVLVSMLKIF